jgi:phenylalanyl-tRNA synthetase alpha chain
VNLIVELILSLDFYKDFDIVQTPEIVGLYETFDLFDFAPNHPARSKSDTYFVTEDKILRTHTTILWYYYLTRPEIKEKLQKEGKLKALSR